MRLHDKPTTIAKDIKGRLRKQAVTALLALASLAAQGDRLKDGFANPPNRAKPRVWWHWMNGNVSKTGITADLEAMARAGIGGAHVFDVGCNVPSGDVKFATPAWDDHLRWAMSEAERLDLELTLVNCSGYANAGGPWIAPSNSMFFLTHSETALKGGVPFTGRLPRETNDHGFYRDIAVVAFPRPACEMTVPGDLAVTSPAENVFVFSSATPFTLRGLACAIDLGRSYAWDRMMTLKFETSDDGRAWTACRSLRLQAVNGGKCDCDAAKGLSRLVALTAPLTARHLRVTADLSEDFCGNGIVPRLATLSPVFRCALPQLNERLLRTVGAIDTAIRETTPSEAVDPGRVIELTDRLQSDGTLPWTPPAGDDWVVIRLGYRSNGVMSHPCSEFGKGLEVDKLDAAAVARHLDAYALKYAKHPGVVSILCDSYEVGSQNWTHGLERIFAARKGHSPVAALAVAMSGRILGSMAGTDAELADFRRVVADLFAENFAGTFARKCAECGVTAALEAYGNGPFDDTAYAWRATQPMTEFWVRAGDGADLRQNAGFIRLAKAVASSAHLRDIPTVDAEGFTAFPDASGKWLKTPFGLKAAGDLMYAHGVSRMVYHRWAHQPWTKPARLPGMTMGQWGTHFERTETWWPMVGPFLAYQARCQYLLQQGEFVADILVFAGDDVPRRALPDGLVPPGVDWDLCGRDALAELKVENGRLRCRAKTSYACLLVPTNVTVTADSRARIEILRQAGARIVSAVPESWPQDFRPEVPTRGPVALHRRYAGGREGYFVAFPSTNAATTVCSFRVSGKVPTLWDPETGRVSRPPAWRAVCADAATGGEERTEVTIPFKPCGAFFVMFDPVADPTALPPEDPQEPFSETPVGGPWRVTFPIGWYTDSAATKTVTLTNLLDWTQFPDPDIRYFSGIATYGTTLPPVANGGRTLLDLGTVNHLAEVTVGGKTFPPLWRPPFVLDITDAVRGVHGDVPLAVRVANLWPNRLIGDERLADDRTWRKKDLKEIPAWVKNGEKSPTGRVTFTTWHHWQKDDPLQPSGLLGPIVLRQY